MSCASGLPSPEAGAGGWGPSLRCLVLAFLMSACGGGSYAVTRVVDGRELLGPYVSDKAYASYLQGAMLEAEGKNEEALAAYELALRRDPESPDIWTRIGSVRCALGESFSPAFDRAISLDSRYEAAWAALAHCQLARGAHEAALEAARRAVAVEPRTIDNVLLYARLLELTGSIDEARSFLDELVIREPLSVQAHRARLDLALLTDDSVRAEAAAGRLLALAPDLSHELGERVPVLSPIARIDRALLGHDLESARRLALSARLASGTVALRAAALGRIEEARDQAKLALLADPSDSDARIATAVIARLANDEVGLEEALSALPKDAPLSPLAARLFDELVRRRAFE